MKKRRIEEDALGKKFLPANVYYGIQTERARENFPISGRTLRHEMVVALAQIKYAACKTHLECKQLSPKIARAILKASQEIIRGGLKDQFVVDIYQAGAGTSFNMNMNEVIANRAIEILRGRRGDYRLVNPNDHVNKAQSTNDVIPTAIRLAALPLLEALDSSLKHLESSFHRKAVAFYSIVKSARTHLQDAVPIRLGRDFGAFEGMIRKSRRRIRKAKEDLLELNIGGTAAGTGLNAYPPYRRKVVRILREITHWPLREAEDLVEIMQNMADFLNVSSALRILAVDLTKIANDLRLLSSGPQTGFDEILLPPVQPGSSIMPGKVNPVMCEMTNMVAFQVIGHDTAVLMASQAGQLELNVMIPLIAYNLLESIKLLTQCTTVFATRCIDGIQANRAKCLSYAEKTVSLATALNPHIGYLKAAKIVKEAVRTHRPIREAAAKLSGLPPAKVRKILDPLKLAGK
ncbi:MAG: aspartate ammonia-lyase [Candidatus Omnitrophica bacterium]|nr:aspartate ammonia-lyase [Candidatus Omnitrophota bacterium]